MLVTFVIPTYRRPAQYLRESIESALGQDFDRGAFEVIVVSDGDPDARETVERYRRVRYLELPENRGQSAALNFALDHARGRYLVVQHDDDRARPNKLKDLVPYLEANPDCGAVGSLPETIDSHGCVNEAWSKRRLERFRQAGQVGAGIVSMAWRNFVAGETILYRTVAARSVGGWDESLPHGEECGFHIKLLMHGWRIGFVDSVTAEYRIHASNKSLLEDGSMRPGVQDVGRGLRQRFRDPVFVNISSLQSRQFGLKAAVESLAPQCDGLRVFLADYASIPLWLKGYSNVEPILGGGNDRGTKEKFRWLGDRPCYYLTCDDDILYPPDYVETLVRGIQRYNKEVLVGFHGAILSRFPVSNYYTDRHLYHFREDLPYDLPVHVIGNVTGGFHTSTLLPRLEDFGDTHRQDDIWLSALAQRSNVPRICLRHPAGWVLPNPAIDQSSSIYETYRRGNPAIAETINSLGRWPLLATKPRVPCGAIGERPERLVAV